MKPHLFSLFLILSFIAPAQTNSSIEHYEQRYEMTDGGLITYKLSLHPNGTFKFHFYRKLICAVCDEENYYGKGNWKVEDKLIYFFADQTIDIDSTFTLDFNSSKARINRKSPRNKTAEIIPETLRFYESKISWVKGMELVKQ